MPHDSTPRSTPPPTELKNRAFAARFAFAISGVTHAFRSERSFRTQTLWFMAALAALAYLRPAPVWWALIIGASCLVLALELINTALERLSDHLHPQSHPRIGQVKDCAAAAVLLATLGAIGIALALAVDVIRHGLP